MARSDDSRNASVVDNQHHAEYDKLLDDRHLHSQQPHAVPMAAPVQDTVPEVSLGGKMLSATAGSLLTSLLVTPLDVVRVRLQSQSHPTPPASARSFANPVSLAQFKDLPPNLGISACCREVFWVGNNASYCIAGPTIAPTTPSIPSIECAVEETRARQFTSTLDGLRKIARYEGATTLWRGLSPTLVMAIPANVIYFAGYDWLRTSPQTPIQGWISDTYAPLAAGASARILAAVAVGPIEMFRTRIQAAGHAKTATGHFRETMHGLRDMVKSQGVHTLWRGLTLTLWRDVPFSALYWWGYETNRNFLTDFRERRRTQDHGLEFERGRGKERIRRRSRSRSNEDGRATLIDSFVAGATSGAFAALVTTPFDVGKTRQQVVQHSGTATSSASVIRPEELSMPRLLAHIYKEQGLSGLFRGWAARCLKVAPACAIMISSYEIGKKMALQVNDRNVED